MRARSRSIALLHLGIFHSNSTSGSISGLGQIDLDAVAGGLDVADIDQARQRRRPEPGNRAAAGVECQVVAGSRVEPARRHDPGIVPLEVALLRAGKRGLVPRMAPVDGVAERVVVDEHLAVVVPVVVVGMAEQDPDAQIDVDQVVRDRLAVDDHARGDEHGLAPFVHVAVGVVAHLGVVERSPAAQQDPPAGRLPRSRATLRKRSRTGRRAWARPSS